jgi:hypothetical protein
MTKGGDVTRNGEKRNEHKLLAGNMKGRDHFEDLGIDGKIILE